MIASFLAEVWPRPVATLHLFEQLGGELAERLLVRADGFFEHPIRLVLGELVEQRQLLCRRTDGDDALAKRNQVNSSSVADGKGVHHANEAGRALRALCLPAPPAKAGDGDGNDDDDQRQPPGERDKLTAAETEARRTGIRGLRGWCGRITEEYLARFVRADDGAICR